MAFKRSSVRSRSAPPVKINKLPFNIIPNCPLHYAVCLVFVWLIPVRALRLQVIISCMIVYQFSCRYPLVLSSTKTLQCSITIHIADYMLNHEAIEETK